MLVPLHIDSHQAAVSDGRRQEYWHTQLRIVLPFDKTAPYRSNFAKQAASLHVVKRLLQEKIACSLGAYADSLHMIDGLPVPTCRFARAHFSKTFKGDAAYGYCAAKKEHYYGFHGLHEGKQGYWE